MINAKTDREIEEVNNFAGAMQSRQIEIIVGHFNYIHPVHVDGCNFCETWNTMKEAMEKLENNCDLWIEFKDQPLIYKWLTLREQHDNDNVGIYNYNSMFEKWLVDVGEINSEVLEIIVNDLLTTLTDSDEAIKLVRRWVKIYDEKRLRMTVMMTGHNMMSKDSYIRKVLDNES